MRKLSSLYLKDAFPFLLSSMNMRIFFREQVATFHPQERLITIIGKRKLLIYYFIET